MNLIYFHTHDSGRELQPYGAAASNPAFMRLASEGILFRDAHCVAPTCSPSRASMLCGMAAHRTGMLGLAHRGFSLSDPSRHLASYLTAQGFYTVLVGVQHEASDASTLGYREVHTDHIVKRASPLVNDEKSLGLALEFLRSKRNGDSPFFLSFGLRSTHRNFVDSQDSVESFVKPPFPIADTPETRHDYAEYLKTLEVADRCLSALLDALDELSLADDTVVLFTTDHGIAFPQMKGTLYDTGTGVALILRIPGKRAFVSDALVSHLDVFPTVCDLFSLPKPDYLEGRSLIPLINGETDAINEYVFCETSYHATYEPSRSVRTKHAKLIRFYEEDRRIRLPNIDASPSKDVFLSSPASRMQRPREMLFDLDSDPTERINLIGVPEYSDIYRELSSALDRHLLETNDPILSGAIPMREGWTMNRTDALDPDDDVYDCHGQIVKKAKKFAKHKKV